MLTGRLCHFPGIEVAARPWLYPRSSFGDTDVTERLLALGHVGAILGFSWEEMTTFANGGNFSDATVEGF